ncbi:MAG TPA: adenosylcobinamide-GDP ribazoletransferase [Actinocrinis sp.]|uniref:adenosylcobinamide-GDP ribazoletransferase n=1 Tax=Actinocrinis sp. TaxID=1920516 RepID=UPI002DDCC3E4|nr:adenosylcobinamide-GDP ribazoletransferase [Actinocrinis sp.]HEV2346065.1 adenosylcobinamide-GDP ribazoletransferase [Actinocrinis sp.]
MDEQSDHCDAAAGGEPSSEPGDGDDGRPGRISGVIGGLRLSVSTLTIVRAGAPRVDRRAAGAAMISAPLVGLGVGAVAAGAGQVVQWWTRAPLISASIAIAALAALTRGLHLDGLADTADGLGSGKPAAEALDIMKQSDIGPFGVVALILVLAVQISSLAAAYDVHRGPVAVVVAAMTGRLAVTAACSGPIPAARPDGLGAWVAGSVRVRTAMAAGIAVAVVSGLLGLIVDPQTAVLAVAAVPLGIAGALVLLIRCVQRFGGITGDVLGALAETGAAIALLVLAARP